MRGVIACACAVAALWTGPAWAVEAQVSWPTYFRTGPGEQFTVVEELLRGRALDLQGCSGDWCQAQLGRVVGYVKRDTINADSFPPSKQASKAECFESGRAGYLGPQPFRYCPR